MQRRGSGRTAAAARSAIVVRIFGICALAASTMEGGVTAVATRGRRYTRKLYYNGAGGTYSSTQTYLSNEQHARLACESYAGAGRCSVGTSCSFYYYYPTYDGSCSYSKTGYEWVYYNPGIYTVGGAYGGYDASVAGDSLFVRYKARPYQQHYADWQLVLKDLGIPFDTDHTTTATTTTATTSTITSITTTTASCAPHHCKYGTSGPCFNHALEVCSGFAKGTTLTTACPVEFDACNEDGSKPTMITSTATTVTATTTTTTTYVAQECNGQTESPLCGVRFNPRDCTSNTNHVKKFVFENCPIMCGLACTTTATTTTVTTTSATTITATTSTMTATTTTTTTLPVCNYPPGNAVPLTKEMYERNDIVEIMSSTCIPEAEFENYAGKVVLAHLPKMVHVGTNAFKRASAVDSIVDLSRSTALQEIGDGGFDEFKGEVRMIGAFSALAYVGDNSFEAVSKGKVEIQCGSRGFEVNTFAFDRYTGTRITMGEDCACDDPCASETTSTTTTTTTATVTSTTTSATSSTTTATATSTTVTTATATTATSTTATLTTTTTTTQFLAGAACSSDSQCTSASCHTYCCARSSNTDGGGDTEKCPYCTRNDGSCYLPLALDAAWNAGTSLTRGWKPMYNKGAKNDLEGPSADFASKMLVNTKGSAKEVRFRLLWGRSTTPATAPRLEGLVASGEGADPGLVDVDAESGAITVLPRRNGNFTVFLVAEDGAGGGVGLPAHLDKVIVKRWSFTVVGKPDFAVISYSRAAVDTLPPIAAGEAPYLGGNTIGRIECVVGTMYHFAPINRTTLVSEYASGGVGATIRFTIRNPPPGFFIEPSTGEVQGNPQAASAGKTYTSALLAVDPAGQEAVLETIVITVYAKPRFIPVFSSTDRTSMANTAVGMNTGAGYIDPTADGTGPAPVFVVGTTYKIATFVLDVVATKVSIGSAADITYTLSSDAPDSFCVQAKSGDISGTFPIAGNYSFALLAVDAAGETAVVEQFDIDVDERPVFEVEVGLLRAQDGPEYTNPWTSSFIIGESYRFSPLTLVENDTTVSSGTFSDITYTLTSPDGWFVSAKTGEIFGQFDSAGVHKMMLYAVDQAGKQSAVEEMVFNVQLRPVFGVASDFNVSQFTMQDVGMLAALPLSPNLDEPTVDKSAQPTNIQYAVGSTVKFPPLQKAPFELFVNPGLRDFSKVTYKVRTFASDATVAGSNQGDTGTANSSGSINSTMTSSPGLWLIDTETAEMLAQPERVGNYSVQVVATDGLGAEVTVRTWTFEVLLKDTDVPEYGPNGRGCLATGEPVDNNAASFDKHYQCDCFGTGYEGDNCEIKIQPTVCAPGEALVDAGVCKPFQLATMPNLQRTAVGPEFTNPSLMQNQFYTVREYASYRIGPLVIDDARTNYSSGNQSDVTYTMKGDTAGFFLNTQTGQMLGTFDNFAADKAATKQFSITLQVVDQNGVHQDLEQMVMNVRYPDMEVDEYGPNQMPCDNNGTRTDSLIIMGAGDRFDQQYFCKCIAVGTTSYSGENCEIAVEASPVTVEGGGDTPVVAGAMAGSVVLIFVVGLILYKRRMYNIKMKAFDFEAEIARLIAGGEIDDNDDHGTESGPRIPREVKRSHITMVQQIGEGAFGEVWKGVLDESSAGGVPSSMVAIKTSKESKGEGADEMLREATVMAQVSGHPNLVSLIGVVTSGLPMMLLISLCEHGSLLSVLKLRKIKNLQVKDCVPFTLAERVKMALDTAKGMAHLSAMSFVHRDLAARNVLVDSQRTCKVADFGLARGIAGARAGPDTNKDGDEEEYYRARTGTFPVRWTSPEAMQTMRFSEATDVWSFAVTLIEIFTDGGKPYDGMANAAVISQVQGGYRAEQPTLCSDEIYAIILECWMAKASERPTFAQLVVKFEDAGVAAEEPVDDNQQTVVPAIDASDEDISSAVLTAAAARLSARVEHAATTNETYMSGEVPLYTSAAVVEHAPTLAAEDPYLTIDGNGSSAADGAEDQYLTMDSSTADIVEDPYLTVNETGNAMDGNSSTADIVEDPYLTVNETGNAMDGSSSTADIVEDQDLTVTENGVKDGGDTVDDPAAVATARFAKAWVAANPTDGNFITAKAVAAALKESGVPQAKLRTIWTSAKMAGNPVAKMNQEEFFSACRLVVEAGGSFSTDTDAALASRRRPEVETMLF